MKHAFSGLIKTTLVSAIAVAVISCGGAEERKVKYLEKGKAYIEEQNYDKALIEIKNVLQIDPKFADAHYVMGQINEQAKEYRKAMGNYQKAVELDPNHINSKIKLARIYVIAGTESYIDLAKKLLSEVEKIDINNTDAKLVRATLEYKVGSKSKAESQLKNIISINRNMGEAIGLLSSIYMIQGKEAEAESLLLQGVNDNKNNIDLRMALANLLAKNNNVVGAEKYLKQAIALEPELYSLKVALASLYVSSNNIDKAIVVLKDAIKQDDEDVHRYLVLIEMLSTRVSIEEAGEELELAIRNKPDMYELKFAQVKFYNRIGKTEQANDILRQIIADKSYDVEGVNARNQLAKNLLQAGDQEEAKKYVDEVLEEYPNDNDALLINSMLSLIRMDAVSAINGLRTVVKNDPKNAEASMLLAQAHELNKESSLAENQLVKAIEANPINDQVYGNYAKYLISKGRTEEAILVVDKALANLKDSYYLMETKLKIISSQGKDAEMLALLNMMEQTKAAEADVNIIKGNYFVSKNEIDKAIEQYEKAYVKAENKYSPLELIVKVHLNNKEPLKAIERLQQRLNKMPDDAIANHLLGRVYLVQKNTKEAREKFKLASRADESWFVPYSSLASTYLLEKDYDRAISIYKSSLPKLDNKIPAQIQLASLHELQSDFSEAMTIYEQILIDSPSNKLAANNYASLLLDYGKDTDVEKALELSKGFEKIQQPALQDTLAWAYAKSGDNQKAIDILKPIVERAPNVAVFRYHLGYALYHSGDKAAAKSHLQIAVDSEQDFPGKIEAEALLKEI